MKKDAMQRALCKSLGEEYRIVCFDGEMVIYRDFGNGFDIEISGTHTQKESALATIFLWFDKCRIVKMVKNVSRTDIATVVEDLYQYSDELIRTGRNTRQAILNLK